MSWITGVGLTPFGKHAGAGTVDLMARAATEALDDAGLARGDIDGLLCGYSTTLPHLMLSSVFAEHYGLTPQYAHGMQVGGATGFAMAALADHLVRSGAARNVLVVAGENRLTGQSRNSAIETLSQVGHPDYEVPFGMTMPAYYALIASSYLATYRLGEADLAEVAVLMRRHASRCPGAHLPQPVTVEEVLASRTIATPLKMMDCCPISDGGAAFVVSAAPTGRHGVRIAGSGQTHKFLHLSAAPSLLKFGAAESAGRALQAAGRSMDDIRYLAIYDSFTITLTVLLEELGLASEGEAARALREGVFAQDGRLPLNTHGGLLAYGHCGVAGALAHLVEAQRQLTGRAGERQVRNAGPALLHGDGGILSSHVSLVLEPA
jgi:acetyl-CoA acetyltransferase